MLSEAGPGIQYKYVDRVHFVYALMQSSLAMTGATGQAHEGHLVCHRQGVREPRQRENAGN
jgi:hypothetical protein